MRWSPRAGFAHAFIHTCEPAVRAFAYGSVSASPRLIQLRTERKQQAGHAHGETMTMVNNYLPVRWGQRRYLVPELQVKEFYKFVAGYGWGPEEWPGDFLVRAEDHDKPASGMPILPPGYERFVKRPIEATVTRVNRKTIRRERTPHGTVYSSLTPITLNVGSAHGVRRGVGFRLIGSEYPENIMLTHVGKHSTKAVIERVWQDGRGEMHQTWGAEPSILKPYLPITVGSRLTTSFELYYSETKRSR